MESLTSRPYFSMLADECVEISTTEELSICCRWIVNGKPEMHFHGVLHISSLDAATIADAICSVLGFKNLDFRKLVGQSYGLHPLCLPQASTSKLLMLFLRSMRCLEQWESYGSSSTTHPKGQNLSRKSSLSSNYLSLRLRSLVTPGGCHMNAVYGLFIESFLPLPSRVMLNWVMLKHMVYRRRYGCSRPAVAAPIV